MSYSASQPRDPKGSPTGGQWTAAGGAAGTTSGGGGGAVAFQSEPTTPPTTEHANVEYDGNNDGVTDAARVGVPAKEVPPPPKVPRLPNLTPEERAVETAFASAFERNPDGMARQYLEMVRKSPDPSKFEVDHAKNLFEPWAGKPDMDPEKRAEMRSTMNTALHQTANAIAKRAFLMHLDEMSVGDKARGLFVTVGGCGSGKGFALKTLAKNGMPEFDTKQYGATWDSAGDQNATENPWLLSESQKRGIPVTFAYISSDPKISWADPKRGVVQRAKDPADGRMVDAAVFADSYILGAKNHAEFSKRNSSAAKFIYVENGGTIRRIDSVPTSDTNRDRNELRSFAVDTVNHTDAPPRIKRGALVGQRIWGRP
jgi:hypothetical protein